MEAAATKRSRRNQMGAAAINCMLKRSNGRCSNQMIDAGASFSIIVFPSMEIRSSREQFKILREFYYLKTNSSVAKHIAGKNLYP